MSIIYSYSLLILLLFFRMLIYFCFCKCFVFFLNFFFVRILKRSIIIFVIEPIIKTFEFDEWNAIHRKNKGTKYVVNEKKVLSMLFSIIRSMNTIKTSLVRALLKNIALGLQQPLYCTMGVIYYIIIVTKTSSIVYC